MRKYVFMGPPGSGKGTQATSLCEEFDLVHISVGDIFRWHVQHHTKLGAQVRRTMAAGELVGDDVVEGIVRERLDQHDWNYGFILDGFPRNVEQAEFFMESYDVDAVVDLDIPAEEVERRVLSRRLCSECGVDYNLMESRPADPDHCDVCGGRLVPREDDNTETLRTRLAEYRTKTAPVAELFANKELLVRIDGTASIDDIAAEIRARLWFTPRAGS